MSRPPNLTNKPKQAKEPRVSCRVPRELMKRLEKVAVANGIDVSDVVRMALNRALPIFETPNLDAAK